MPEAPSSRTPPSTHRVCPAALQEPRRPGPPPPPTLFIHHLLHSGPAGQLRREHGHCRPDSVLTPAWASRRIGQSSAGARDHMKTYV